MEALGGDEYKKNLAQQAKEQYAKRKDRNNTYITGNFF
jgi:hypothetical protein